MKRQMWIVVLAAASLAFSVVMACGMPFAAVAALGAVALGRRDAYAVAILAFAINQLVGFGLLAYPLVLATVVWGAAIGMSAVVAVTAARSVASVVARHSWPVAVLSVFLAALVAQQGTIFAASFPLGAHPIAFSPAVLAEIAGMNLLAFGALAVLQVGGARIGWARMPVITA